MTNKSFLFVIHWEAARISTVRRRGDGKTAMLHGIRQGRVMKRKLRLLLSALATHSDDKETGDKAKAD